MAEPPRYYGGIDPGKEGAFALLREDGSCFCIFDAVDQDTSLATIKLNLHQILFLAIEEQQPYEGQAVTNFKMGRAQSFWEGVCAALGISYMLIPPKIWQKRIIPASKIERQPKSTKVDKKEKARQTAARRKANKLTIWTYARNLWPAAILSTPRGKKLDGRSDALCIADYGRRWRQGKIENA